MDNFNKFFQFIFESFLTTAIKNIKNNKISKQQKRYNIQIKTTNFFRFYVIIDFNIVLYIVPINNSQKIEIIKQTSISNLTQQKMNSQIVLSLQKLMFQQKQNKFEQKIIQIQILTDSCFQKIITQRKIKNNCANLFGQKIFLPSNTKQVLFDVTVQQKKLKKQRICCFSYEIEKLSAINKKKILQNLYLSQQKKEPICWNLHISTKLNLELQTNTLLNTEQLISDLYSPMNEISNIITQFNNSNNLNHYNNSTMNSFKNNNNRIFSPNHQQSKFKNQYFKSINLNHLEDQNWEIKSELSPSKKAKQLKQNCQSNNFRKQQNSIWLQPVISPKISIQKNPQEQTDFKMNICHEETKKQLYQYKKTFQTESVNEESGYFDENICKKNVVLQQTTQIDKDINCPYIVKISQNVPSTPRRGKQQVESNTILQKKNKNLNKYLHAVYHGVQQQKKLTHKNLKSVQIPHDFRQITDKKLNNSFKYLKGNQIKLMLIIGGFLGILCAWLINKI